MKIYEDLYYIITHEAEKILAGYWNVGMKLEQACKPILGRQKKKKKCA